MEKIASFEVDHDKLRQGLYTSRIDGKDGDIITYDLRMTVPNQTFLTPAGAHTFEHLFATYARMHSGKDVKDHVIYVGPMGCLTGFYAVVQDLSQEKVLEMIKGAMVFVSEFTGEIPGAARKECGNYKMHDLEKAKEYGKNMCEILKDWTTQKMNYAHAEKEIEQREFDF